MELTECMYEPGHRIERVLGEWNAGLQGYAFVVIHSPSCPACWLENRLAERKEPGEIS